MNVLSLFDGISCGRVALDKANIKVDNYFASEIDKYAMSVSIKNYKDIVQIGDVSNIHYTNWGIEVDNQIGGMRVLATNIDLLIGGSPCQSLSSLGDGTGLNGKSKLFWEYVRILKEIRLSNPNVKFLFENVQMKKEWAILISKELGVQPIRFNSNSVSAQNRERLYWTNIPVNSLPINKNIKLADIIDRVVDEKYYLSDKAVAYITNKDRIEKKFTQINGEKSICLSKQYNLSKNGTFLCVDANGRIDSQTTGTLTKRYAKGVEKFGSNPFIYDGRFRKLTPIECERLQTLPDNYTSGISDTQRYFSIGNGWTIDIIAHILKHIK